MDAINRATTATTTTSATRTEKSPEPTNSSPVDGFSGSVEAVPAGLARSRKPKTDDPTSDTPKAPRAKPGQTGPIEAANPLAGTVETPPKLNAGILQSPKYLGTEAEYFKEARRLIESAQPGDIILNQMYEFENAATNGDKSAATRAPGYADQQALEPGLKAAAARGVKVNGLYDASKNHETHDFANAPIVNDLVAAAKVSGNLTVDYYPPEVVNIDHAKQLILLTPSKSAPGEFDVQEAIGGGSNWGNHTPANDDGGGAFYGRDAVPAAKIFYRDQAFARGERTAPADPNPSNPSAPVEWKVTSPPAEGGGSTGILEAELALTKEADAVSIEEFCFNHPGMLEATAAKGAGAHVMLDPNEGRINRGALEAIRQAGGEAKWDNTERDPNRGGMKLHAKEAIYLKDGKPFAATIGSANTTNNGLEMGGKMVDAEGKSVSKKTNHEVDVVIRSFSSDEKTPDGTYSTKPFLDAVYADHQTAMQKNGLDNPPSKLSGTGEGQF